MKNDANLMSQTLTDNDDIRQLISVVDSDFRHYDEITFQESVKTIYNKWPLLNEVRQNATEQARGQTTMHNVTHIQSGKKVSA